ncbi:hypothetical protein IPM09_00345 [Candidatus Saccharibacteria bacterium]|nr:MAG: hypothetical protein IPM09_00345 [Candidatus Saccharibacteria bacterium]
MRPKLLVSLVCVMVLGIVTTHRAAALATTETYFPLTSPLIISAYQTQASGKDVGLIELYNDGDIPLDITKWSIVDDINKRTLQISSHYSGLLEPNRHVVLAKPLVVDPPSTYQIDGWHETVVSPLAITTLSLRSPGFRNNDVAVKLTTALMQRNRGVDGYLSTFTDVSYRSLFDDGLYVAPQEPKDLMVDEIYSYASDCAPFDASVLCSDYVKLVNTGNDELVLDEYVLRTDSSSSNRTASNTIHLAGSLAPGDYKTVWLTDDGSRLSLTNSGGYVWLEDTWGTTHYDSILTHYPSAGVHEQGLAYARNAGSWSWTTTPQPDRANLITLPIEPVTECPASKYRNPDTGRCRSVEEAVNELATCPEGQMRNPDTNRCRATASAKLSVTPCGEGQERNPLTNRCRSIASAVAELLPCDEGYERNPATNRCRKQQTSAMPLAPFPVQPVATSSSSSTMWWTAGAVAAVALGYAAWEWRREFQAMGLKAIRVVTRRW